MTDLPGKCMDCSNRQSVDIGKDGKLVVRCKKCKGNSWFIKVDFKARKAKDRAGNEKRRY